MPQVIFLRPFWEFDCAYELSSQLSPNAIVQYVKQSPNRISNLQNYIHLVCAIVGKAPYLVV